MKTISVLFTAFIFLCLFHIPALCTDDVRTRDQNTDITSDKMIYEGDNNVVVFSGNVHVVRPDLELWSRELHVFLKPGQEGDAAEQQDNIEKIQARGEVRILSQNREGQSDLLTYFPDTGIARLEGNPRLIEERNSVEGEIIILNMNDNISEVLGGPDRRVRVIFQSDSETRD